MLEGAGVGAAAVVAAALLLCLIWAGLGRVGVGGAAVVAAAMLLLLLCLSWAGLQNLSASCFLSTCFGRRFSLNAFSVSPLGPVQARGGPIGTLDFLNFTDLYLLFTL